ncbi:hypothetical protein FRC09_019302 [Ceratobasidium sp. 395]|nr:hypothetical protein FRC09_019302 [Ceratobasidium sp. 395]
MARCSEIPYSGGGFGDVYQGTMLDGTKIALKCLRVYMNDSETDAKAKLKYAARELHTWSKCRHPNIVELLGLAEFRGKIAMVSPWMENGSVNRLSSNHTVDRCRLSFEVASGLAYLHGIDIVHGDLKGANIMLSENNGAQLADFGNAVLANSVLDFTGSSRHSQHSTRWAAPEQLSGMVAYSHQADIHSLGMEIVSRQVPFAEMKNEMAIALAITNGKRPERPESTIPTESNQGNKLWSLLGQCWDSNPEERPEALVVVEIIREIRSEDLLVSCQTSPKTSALALSPRLLPNLDATAVDRELSALKDDRELPHRQHQSQPEQWSEDQSISPKNDLTTSGKASVHIPIAWDLQDSRGLDEEVHPRMFEKVHLGYSLTGSKVTILLNRLVLISLLTELGELKPVGHARYDPDQACIPGTRTALIDDIINWAQDDTARKPIYWVYGFAGLGKSSIAASLCQRLDEQNMLAASFLCKHDDPNLRDPQRVFNTIVHGLATRYKPYALAVARAIRGNAQPCSSHIPRRYIELVKKPLESLLDTSPTRIYVIVVDALDECEGKETRASLFACLRSMSQLVPWLKLIVTSRPDKDIEAVFGRGNDYVVSHDLGEDAASEDIHTFAHKHMSQITTLESRSAWLDDMTQKLVERANGLFIWAAVVCKFVKEGTNPKGRLEDLLRNTASAVTFDPFARLHELYGYIVRSSTVGNGRANRQVVRRCLGAIVCSSRRAPLSVLSLKALLSDEIDIDALGLIVKALGSVLYEDGGTGGPVRMHHSSFEDYLVSHSELPWVNVDELDATFARCCLNDMLRSLRFNICGLETSHMLNRKVSNLETQESIADCSNDAYRFIQTFYDAISESMPHLYLSALAFAPVNSEISRRMRPHFPNLPTIPPGGGEQWSACLQTILISDSANTLKLTPNGSHIISGHKDGTVQVWDVDTGAAIVEPLQGHSAEVLAITTSSDTQLIASGSADMTVRVWDIETGSQMLMLKGHQYGVCAVAFSSNDRLIASGSSEGEVKVWGLQDNGTLVLDVCVGEGYLEHVQFWHQSLYVFSGPRLIIDVWNGDISPDATLETIPSPKEWWEPFATGLYKDHCLIACSTGSAIGVWDCAARVEVCKMHGTYFVTSGAFSSDGRYLVSSSIDNTIQVWDVRTGELVGDDLYHHSPIRAVVFSPRHHRIISVSNDRIIRVWSNNQQLANTSDQYYNTSYRVSSVAWSPNGDCFASSHDPFSKPIHDTCLFRVWDTYTGALILAPQLNLTAEVLSAAFSPDGSLIAAGLGNGQVMVCDADSGSILHVLESFMDRSQLVGFWHGKHLVYSCCDESLRAWDLSTGTLMRSFTRSSKATPWYVVIAPNAKISAISTGDIVEVRDVETGTLISELHNSERVTCLAFSPDSRYIAAGSMDTNVKIWEARAGIQIVGPLRGHTRSVVSVAFSHHGRFVASGSEDCAIRVWDSVTGVLVYKPLLGHSDPVLSVAFSYDDYRILSHSAPSQGDHSIRIWDLGANSQENDPMPLITPTESDLQSSDPMLRSQVPVSLLARHLSSGGWVTTANKEYLLWLPVEFRQIDDSSLCISSESTRLGMAIDMRRFVHGTSWTSVIGPAIEVDTTI